MGAEYARIAKIEVKATRSVISKITGKRYSKKVDNTGKLADSFGHDIETTNSGPTLSITAASYAQDVSEGTKRAANRNSLASWITSKPYKFEVNGKGIPTTAKLVLGFSKFLAWKISNIGSDRTGYLDGIQEKVSKKFSEPLAEAVTQDIAVSLVDALDSLKNTTAVEI